MTRKTSKDLERDIAEVLARPPEPRRVHHATKKTSPVQLDREIVEALEALSQPTNQQLEQLRHEALLAHNDELARTCAVALGEPSSRQASARRECVRILAAVNERYEKRSEERARERSYTGQMGSDDD